MSPTPRAPLRMTLEERIACVRLFSKYQNISDVQKVWRQKFGKDPPCRSSIMGVNKKFDETGSVLDVPRNGRPRKCTSEENVALVHTAMDNDPSKTIREIAKELEMTKTTVFRIKKDLEKKGSVGKVKNIKMMELNTPLRVEESLDKDKQAPPPDSDSVPNENESNARTEADGRGTRVEDAVSGLITLTRLDQIQGHEGTLMDPEMQMVRPNDVLGIQSPPASQL